MLNEYRYQLDRGSKKHHCPKCGKRRFVRYVDKLKGEHLPQQYGRCDREITCAYHLNPYLGGYNKNVKEKAISYAHNEKRIQKLIKIYYIPKFVLKSTLQGYENNTFIQNLLNRVTYPFDAEDVEKIIAQYYLGTIVEGYFKNGITIPFIDQQNNVRAIQAKLFDKHNHTSKTNFLHTILSNKYKFLNQTTPEWLRQYQENDLKVSCLFGEHLLNKFPNNPIALVEAPKTAIYATLYFGFPDTPTNLLWLAVYNLSSLNLERCKVLINRNVFLFPDLSANSKAYQLWCDKANILNKQVKGSYFEVSTLLEDNASEGDKAKGLDLADYLIQQDWREVRRK